ncbi:MAG: hypothetical protein RR662_05285 [Clostridia bacterium]
MEKELVEDLVEVFETLLKDNANEQYLEKDEMIEEVFFDCTGDTKESNELDFFRWHSKNKKVIEQALKIAEDNIEKEKEEKKVELEKQIKEFEEEYKGIEITALELDNLIKREFDTTSSMFECFDNTLENEYYCYYLDKDNVLTIGFCVSEKTEEVLDTLIQLEYAELDITWWGRA